MCHVPRNLCVALELSRIPQLAPFADLSVSQLRASDDLADFIYEAESEFTNSDAVTRFNGLDFVFFFGAHSVMPWFPVAHQVGCSPCSDRARCRPPLLELRDY